MTLDPSTMSLPSDVSNVNVTCAQYTGPGSNTFGGYAVVAGVNVNNATGAFQRNAAAGCVSMSSDPVGSGAPTFATSVTAGSTTCMKYPSSAASPPSWVKNFTPDATAAVTGDFAFSATEQWFVGTTAAGGPFVWFSPDGDNYAIATGTGGGVLPATFHPTKVWAAGPLQVFVVGTTTAGTGAVYLSSNSENSTSPGGVVTWTSQAIAGAKTLTDVYGLPGDPGNVWAVGTTASGPAVWFFNGAAWSAAIQLAGGTTVQGVWATDATHAWAVGSVPNGGSTRGAIWATTNNVTWGAATTLSNSLVLNGIAGTDINHLWAVGQGSSRGVVTASVNGTAWNAISQIGSGATITTNFTGVTAIDANDIFAVGMNGANAVIWNCTGATCTSAAPPWTAQILPSPALPALTDVSGLKVVAGPVTSFVISATGLSGEVLAYAPTQGNACSGNCLAKIMGPVYNADLLNLPSGLQLANGAFTQYSAAGCAAPANLIIGAPFGYNCTATPVPATVAALSKPLPTAKPGAPLSQTGTALGASGSCPGYTYFTPGTYTSQINFQPHTTYFFESGVYNFEGNLGALDNLSSPPSANDLYIIGGKPSPGDVPTYAQNSPCWAAIQANGAVWNGGSGTGVEWILPKTSWLDVHTVNFELFTREGGAPSEGAQGLSVRDVSGVSSGPWLSDQSNRPAPNMVLQVDANSPPHYPNVYVHGGIWLPNENVEEYTNSGAVTLGPIFANSIEFTFFSTLSPQLLISGGAPGNPTVVFTAKAGGVTIQSFVPYDTTGASPVIITDPAKGYNWRVLSPS
jgi:hypothetical protein